jgi:two-component system, NtrC family, sensor histidine kinase PilS
LIDIIFYIQSTTVFYGAIKTSNTSKMTNASDTSKIEETLCRQEKLEALERLTANIAHEIRNPLGAIGHACQLLEEDECIQSSSKRALSIITKNVQRINQMIDEILHAHHHDPSKIVTIQLNKFLKDFHEYFCETEKISSQHFALNLSHAPIFIEFNPLHLDQVLWNLCRNGWRHCSKKMASFNISLEVLPQNKVAINIKNDGDDINAEKQAHIFEPFFTTEPKGTGLGLYIARQLCLRNHAALLFESRQQETIFSIQLQKAVI